MGVPGFFAWLLRKTDRFLTKMPNKRPKMLYLDANCLFHPRCFGILETYDGNGDLEDRMIRDILEYIELLIAYVQSENVYIAVDGVAPIAKIQQQRKRRYKAYIDTKLRDELKDRYGMSRVYKWSNTSITPGTRFMEKLDMAIRSHNTKWLYSSYLEPCEGEHKILTHIKQSCYTKEDTIVIYGLDADLIFLSIASQKNNIYLLREQTNINKKDGFVYIDIDIVKKQYSDNIIKQADSQLVCNDLVFLCFFLGNDFLPNIPSIDIKQNGMNILIEIYTKILSREKSHMISNGKINMTFFIKVLELISMSEIDNILKKYTRQKICPNDLSPYEKELWDMENMNIDIFDPIQIGKSDDCCWKTKYYRYHHNITNGYIREVNKLCKLYLDGLLWITQYYFDKCPSWNWFYMYNKAPFASDILMYIKQVDYRFEEVKFELTEPLTPNQQLLKVIPPNCSFLLNDNDKALVDNPDSIISHNYPNNVHVDMINKDLWWQCECVLPV